MSEGQIMRIKFAPAEALALLVDDLRLVEAGRFNAIDLRDAPILYNHCILPLSVGMLSGVVEGHPRLGSGRKITTSQVFYIDTEVGVARTMSRWYRLDIGEGKERH